MSVKLFIQALSKFMLGVLVLGALLFLSAGTLRFWNGWLFLALLFVPMFIAGVILMLKNPELLKKRLSAKESQTEQKRVLLFSGLMFLAAFVIAGLNFRFGWLEMPRWSVWLAAAVFLAAYGMYGEVLRVNVFFSRTVEVQEHQTVVDTGLYGIVRHPMYAATVLLFLSMGLVLGSPLSFAVLLAYIPIIAKRIKNEEAVLLEGLDGYAAYCEKVKYRMIPLIW